MFRKQIFSFVKSLYKMSHAGVMVSLIFDLTITLSIECNINIIKKVETYSTIADI